ncbi:MAG: 4Fe-4S dicluster domain-containing protein [Pseudomonadota bacterium]
MSSSSETLRGRVTLASGQDPFRCYQCGNCSAGCPMAGKGDLLPHQVFRHLQIDSDEPLRSVQPWLCVGCQTCAVRCPQELDLSLVMDALRAEAEKAGTVPAEARRMREFNRIFVDQVMSGGRLSEMELGAMFNWKTRNPFENVSALPSLLKRGKVRLSFKKVRGPGKIHRKEKSS